MSDSTVESARSLRGGFGQAPAFAAVCLGFFAVILDTTIVNVALPAIGASFDTTVTSLQWVVNGYNIVFAALLLACGAMADRQGGKRAFTIGTAVFIVGSLGCGLAQDLPALLCARVVQGCGAALLMPASLALVAHIYPAPAARTKALAIWAACAGAATATGPVLGGLLVDTAGWRSIFLVNLPVGLIAIALLHGYSETAVRKRGLDLWGQSLGIVLLAAVAYGITEAGPHGWTSAFTVVPLAVGIAAAVAFVATERRVASPLLPPGLLSHRGFSVPTGVGLLLNFGIYGQVFVLSLYFQQARHYSALMTGLMLLPFAGVTLVGPPMTGRLTTRFGTRPLMICGQFLAAAGSGALALAGLHTSYLLIAPGLFVLGLGMAATMPSMTVAVMQAAPREFAGIASGVLTAARQVGGVLGVALLGTLIADTVPFSSAMHRALTIVTCTFLIGAVLSMFSAHPSRQGRTAPVTAALPAEQTGEGVSG